MSGGARESAVQWAHAALVAPHQDAQEELPAALLYLCMGQGRHLELPASA